MDLFVFQGKLGRTKASQTCEEYKKWNSIKGLETKC